jgi:hypothetical protein
MEKRIDEKLEAFKEEIAAEVARRVAAEVERLMAALRAPPAESVNRSEACRRLGIGLTKLKGLIRRGELSLNELGDIPVDEIQRLARPVRAVAPRRGGGRKRSPTYDPLVDFAPAKRGKKR